MCFGGDDGGAEARRREQEANRQRELREGRMVIKDNFSQFTPDFYRQREQAYMDYALPQLDEQYEKEKEGLIFALARGGRLNSRTRADKLAELEQQYNQNRAQIRDRGISMANETRQNIERARSNLLSQNSTVLDGQSMAQLASQQASALSASPAFDPLGTMFQNTTAGLATAQDAAAARDRMNRANNLYLANVAGKGSQRTVGG